MVADFSLTHPLFELLIAMFLGAFLGIRREMRAIESAKERSFMGVRTMTMLCAMGTISTFFPDYQYLPLIIFGGILSLVVIAYSHGSFAMKRIGITTELSAMLTYWIGVLVGVGEPVMAIVLTIFLASLNAFKDKLHGFVQTLNEEEWIGSFQLLALSGAILPFLPRTPIDPWGVLIPFNIWLLVMLISGIGFVGYFLIKYFGARGGVPLTGFLGSLISSTAVTTSMAAQSAKIRLSSIFAVGILIGLATMQVRVLVEILLLGTKEIIEQLVWIPISMAIAGAILALYLFKRSDEKLRFWETHPDIKIDSPFEIKPALQFGAIFVIVLLAVVFGKKYFGESGVYMAAMFSGIIDVDAIVLSTLESAKLGEFSSQVAANSIAIALFTNTIIKILYVGFLGSKKLLKKVAISVAIVTAVGVATMMLV